MNQPRLKLGELLVNSGILTEENLKIALDIQKERQLRLGTILLQEQFVSENNLMQALSRHLSIPWVSIWRLDVPEKVYQRVPVNVAEEFFLFPIYIRNEKNGHQALYVAMNDPEDQDAMRFVAAASGMDVKPMIAGPSDIAAAIHYYYYNETAEEEEEISVSDGSIVDLNDDDANQPDSPHVPNLETPHQATIQAETSPRLENETASSTPEAPMPVTSEPASPETPSSPPDKAAVPSAAPSSQQTALSSADARLEFNNRQSAQREAERRIYGVGRKKTSGKFALTLLDGTTLSFGATDSTPPESETEPDISQKDFIAGLKAAAKGTPIDDFLPATQWQSYVAAITELLISKGIIQFEEIYRLLVDTKEK